MYARPTIGEEPTTLGVSGKLWRDALIMYDRETRSLWSQILGEAVAGPLKGRRLQELPSQVTTWGEWKRRHPETLVLTRPREVRGSPYARYFDNPDMIGVRGSENPDPRLPGKSLVMGMELADGPAALPLAVTERHLVWNGEARGLPIVAFSPPGEPATHIFERRVGDRELRFTGAVVDGELQVRETTTGTSWSWETGECLTGDCPVEGLQWVSARPVYWGVWAQFHRRSEIVGPVQIQE